MVTDRPALPPAPVWRRLAAMLYDLLFVALLCWLAAAAVTLLGGGAAEAGTWSSAAVLLAAGLLNGLYFCLSWMYSGQTIGMKSWKLKIQRTDGRRLNWHQSLLRLLLAITTILPLGIGWLWLLVNRRKQTMYDVLNDTEMLRI